jgi:hypothetical protein
VNDAQRCVRLTRMGLCRKTTTLTLQYTSLHFPPLWNFSAFTNTMKLDRVSQWHCYWIYRSKSMVSAHKAHELIRRRGYGLSISMAMLYLQT